MVLKRGALGGLVAVDETMCARTPKRNLAVLIQTHTPERARASLVVTNFNMWPM
jgi:hypothetical protein